MAADPIDEEWVRDIATVISYLAERLSRLDTALRSRVPPTDPKGKPALRTITGGGRVSKKPPAKLTSIGGES